MCGSVAGGTTICWSAARGITTGNIAVGGIWIAGAATAVSSGDSGVEFASCGVVGIGAMLARDRSNGSMVRSGNSSAVKMSYTRPSSLVSSAHRNCTAESQLAPNYGDCRRPERLTVTNC